MNKYLNDINMVLLIVTILFYIGGKLTGILIISVIQTCFITYLLIKNKKEEFKIKNILNNIELSVGGDNKCHLKKNCIKC